MQLDGQPRSWHSNWTRNWGHALPGRYWANHENLQLTRIENSVSVTASGAASPTLSSTETDRSASNICTFTKDELGHLDFQKRYIRMSAET
jgi:hypothetical protein